MKKVIALLIVVMSLIIIAGCDNKSAVDNNKPTKQKYESADMEIASDPIALQLEREKNHADKHLDNVKNSNASEDDLQNARELYLVAANRYYARCKKIRDKYK